MIACYGSSVTDSIRLHLCLLMVVLIGYLPEQTDVDRTICDIIR
jgi:hypothetical protein